MKRKIPVFIVLKGERGNGGCVVSVHRTKKAAIKAALAVPCCFDGGWRYDGPTSWKNGIDFVLWQKWPL